MKILYSDGPAFAGGLSIFLAGPTPRSKDVKSWRPEALEILQQLGFEGTVLVPERNDWSVKFDYTDQIDWEFAGLSDSTVIVFWVPRDMAIMPALTTNVEFGYWIALAAERVIYGRPENAASIRYLDWMLKKCSGREPLKSLEEALRTAIKLAGAKNA
jgi:hypothetical protein